MTKFESKKFFRRSFKSNRIALKPVKKKDAGEIFNLVSGSDLHKFTFVPKQYSLQIAKEWIRKQNKFPQTFVIVLTKDKAIIGVIGVVSDDFRKRHWEIAYWLGQAYRNKRYMREAIDLFIQQAKKYTPIRKISAKVFVGNNRSIKLLQSISFIKEGLLRNHFYHNGRMKSIIVFGYCIK